MTAIPKPLPRPRKPRVRVSRTPGSVGRRTSRRRKQRKTREKDCDRAFSILIRTRDDWQCRACGSPKHPQCAHILSRAYRVIRFDPRNAVCLCRDHHRKWSYPNTVEWEDWVEERMPGRPEELKQKVRMLRWAKDYDATLLDLNQQLDELQTRRSTGRAD